MRVCVLLLQLFVLALLVACSLLTSKPTVIIVSPPSGSEFLENEPIAVQSVATDSTGIARVELLVNGTVVRTDASPVPQVSFTLIQTWQAVPGTHTISVRAYNTAGVVSEPAAITVSVIQVSVPVPAATAFAPVPSATPAVSATATATPTPAVCTNDAQFDRDVTVPDGTTFAAGQTFDKVWRVRNTGTCAWGQGYQLVFVSGTALTTNTVVNVPPTARGASVDLKVPMTAPTTPGTYTGVWQLRAPTGTFFGTRVRVMITVPSASGCVGMPNIASFTASATNITAGMSVTLNWGLVSNAESAEIDQGIGGVETPGWRVVTPITTTTYTMTARCGANVRTARVTITVQPAPAACSGTPIVTSFFATRTRIKPGESTTLNWGAVHNAEYVEIEPGIGGVATPGSISVSPVVTTTFTLTAKCGNVATTRQETIQVVP